MTKCKYQKLCAEELKDRLLLNKKFTINFICDAVAQGRAMRCLKRKSYAREALESP